MKMEYIDLRSDTVTKPSKEMLEAMMKADVGDDVYGEDPTVNLLQKRIAEMFGKESALFVPSGTMGNEICIKVHTQPGDEIIVEQDSHIFVYETAGPSLLSGVQMKTIAGKNGSMTVEQIKNAIRPKVYYLPNTKLICMENTHGRSGGSIIPLEDIKRIREVALGENIKMHLDGARIWNASIETGISLSEYAKYFDSLLVCFSKGLGAPIGSIIIGDTEFIDEARRYRKIFGGGMRQVGILAAAAIYAIDHNIDRLKEDHKKAKIFAEQLNFIKNIQIVPKNIETNMVMIDISSTGKTQAYILNLLKDNGLLLTPERTSLLRAVMHLDVSLEQVYKAIDIFKTIFQRSLS